MGSGTETETGESKIKASPFKAAHPHCIISYTSTPTDLLVCYCHFIKFVTNLLLKYKFRMDEISWTQPYKFKCHMQAWL
jgi:hypothetical protein